MKQKQSRRPITAAMPWCTRVWLSDPAVSRCQPATRGVLMDLLCAMHEAGSPELRGTVDQLARVARCSPADFIHAAKDLKANRAADVSERRGGRYVIRQRPRRAAAVRSVAAVP